MNFDLIVSKFMIDYGPISIFLFVLLEYANAPIPSELLLPLIGVVAKRYNIDMFQIALITTLAGILGSLINYWIGMYFGERILKFIVRKVPKTRKSVYASKKFILKYSALAILISRFVPIARTMISVVAGVAKIDFISFVVYSSLGILIWNMTLIYGGQHLDNIFYYISNNLIVISGLIIIGTIGYLIYLKKHKTKSDKVNHIK